MKSVISLLLGFLQRYVYTHRSYEKFCRIWMSIRSRWIRTAFKNCPSTVRFGRIGHIHCPWCISIGDSTCIGDDLYLTAWEYQNHENHPILQIGDHCSIGAFFHITCTNKILIGDNVMIGKWVTVTDNSHGTTDLSSLRIKPSSRPVVSKGAVSIEDDVWICDKVTILPGVHIGKGSVIAANSVVTKNVPPYCVVAGNPAKIIKNAGKVVANLKN